MTDVCMSDARDSGEATVHEKRDGESNQNGTASEFGTPENFHIFFLSARRQAEKNCRN